MKKQKLSSVHCNFGVDNYENINFGYKSGFSHNLLTTMSGFMFGQRCNQGLKMYAYSALILS